MVGPSLPETREVPSLQRWEGTWRKPDHKLIHMLYASTEAQEEIGNLVAW